MTGARSFSVRFHRDLHPGPSGYGTTGIDWRLYTYGPGNWCVGDGHAGSFTSEAAANAAGDIWVQTGLPPCEQTPERIAEAVAAGKCRLEDAA